jgi:hypothetical protein
MSKKKENKLIKWFIDEGALIQENNLYKAERVFQANSFVSWIRKNSIGKTLDKKEIEQSMLAIRMFLQKKINLEWKNGTINVSDILLNEEESNALMSAAKME